MTPEELRAKLTAREDNFIERKLESVKDRDIKKAVVAFANSLRDGREGVLFIGVAEDGTPVGCSNPDDKQKKVRKACEQDCYLPIEFTTEVLSIGDVSVVAVVVPESSNKPHFSGPAFVRRGSESVAASPKIFEQLIFSRTSKVSAINRIGEAVVTVISLKHKLGGTRIILDASYREKAECRIVECTPQIIRLQNISTSEFYSEALDRVEVGYDEDNHRSKLVISGF